MFNPISTYRVQLHKGFGFGELKKIIPYLKKLGVKTIYAAPILEAVPGSMHGYDGVNPDKINPEIGTEEQFREICSMLHENDMQWIQDIVPNHMAFHSNNSWLMDVLEKGLRSAYISFFDIFRTDGLYQGRLMAPFLGAPIEEIIKNHELEAEFRDARFVFNYYDHIFPLRPETYTTILSAAGNPPESIQQLIRQIVQVDQAEEHHAYHTEWEEIRKQLASLMEEPVSKSHILNCLAFVNQNQDALKKLSDRQFYQLCHWQETEQHINYRRFFTINGLICLNIQDQEVFKQYHRYIKSLLDSGMIQGLRIDHIDGLYDPSKYLEQLRALAGKDTYMVVEKILQTEENMPAWPVQGSTGYDFLAVLNNLLIKKDSEAKFTQFYQDLTANKKSLNEQIRKKKTLILKSHMEGELENLYQLFLSSDLSVGKNPEGLQPEILKECIAGLLIECPVYRFYGNAFPLQKQEQRDLLLVLNRIKERKPELNPAIDLLEHVLITKANEGNAEYNKRALGFYQRLMQFSGPLMAKGVEDTLMYTYCRFLGSNEVGDSPENFGISVSDFHERMKERQKKWPLSMNVTSTHDTKRGEDVNARLNVLTEIPDEWMQKFQEWHSMNAGLKINGMPDVNDEYFLYQALIGTFPMQEEDEAEFPGRLKAYLSKALREGKINSSWTKPNEEYENAFYQFALSLLDNRGTFRKSFKKFQKKVADFGIINSLAKVILKYTCPGVPDLYQGSELWDLSMVDPDNRRPVDYSQRMEWLNSLSFDQNTFGKLSAALWQNRSDGRIKLWLTHTLLKLRNDNPELFLEGQYIPLQIEGKFKEHVFAFARRYKKDWYVVALHLHLADLSAKLKKDLLSIDWKDTGILLPAEAPEDFTNVLSKTKGKAATLIPVREIFKDLPLSVLKLNQPQTDRSAGVLMHITSLPSGFGVGDFGPEARKFADFLSRSCQRYWQILPLNITEAGNGHSPYSSISSMAGNTLLLSPELMAEDGLLNADMVMQYHQKPESLADFAEAERVKGILFEKAFQNFLATQSSLQEQFTLFCEQEAGWLDDFALYVTLKNHYGAAWFQWPHEYKLRDEEALADFFINNSGPIQKIKWLQFMFTRQWKSLKKYVNDLGIKLFGDLPFYVSYDSADVWANPDIFSLDEKGNMIGVAGVPPDYFNSDGQLWGMPVFKWDVLKKRGYDWWIARIKKNMELYDVLRLDHFRAFADYWEVPAGETTAINGVWRLGPGADFFKAIKSALAELSFIAEDLGDINPLVHKLRDELNLPGMKVLQFAFSEDMPSSIYIPHNHLRNYIVYTGTHDNNTTVGWFRQNAGKLERKNLECYTGIKPKEKNIHQILGRLAYASVAKTAILPMQDVLGLDEHSRMNIPASTDKNWLWRLVPGQIKSDHEEMLREWVRVYNR
jgi:malto-oligosyltrehalose synthase/4-alpha-glucanotransferase